jgi:hypothetical protein
MIHGKNKVRRDTAIKEMIEYPLIEPFKIYEEIGKWESDGWVRSAGVATELNGLLPMSNGGIGHLTHWCKTGIEKMIWRRVG